MLFTFPRYREQRLTLSEMGGLAHREQNVNSMFCVVTRVRTASPNIFAKSFNPPHSESKFAIYHLGIGAKRWKSSKFLHVLQVKFSLYFA